MLKKAAGVNLVEKVTFEARFEGRGKLAMVSEGRRFQNKGNSQWECDWELKEHGGVQSS